MPPDVRQFEPLAGENAEAAVLHLVRPAGSSSGATDQRKLARADEADGRISPPAGRRGAPWFHEIQWKTAGCGDADHLRTRQVTARLH
jgi:hypothetical protein